MDALCILEVPCCIQREPRLLDMHIVVNSIIFIYKRFTANNHVKDEHNPKLTGNVVGTRCVDGRVPNCLLGGVGGGVGGK